jgi:phosphomannomutase/phosphoglucomutase
VHDIGLALSPMAYFAQFDLDCPLRGHGHRQPQRERLDRREDGRAQPPLTFGPDEMGA